ncbi:uncharacterized protein LOC123269093 [Cotesia glomerata]|uniref:uncharacterized protein LOC123269093 n=1 Tax=Cotesia glomerata TaxID=32391 RepID=UPI001D013D45|nr:uncharacterized protein LOC123269093 [Cotesia glomerata]
MKCTRACKECKGESCSNATDLVQLTENANEDEEDDDDDFDYISEKELEKRNTKRLAYEKFKRSIYGLDDTDSEEEEEEEEEGEKEEEDQIEEDNAVEETVEVSRTSNVDEPNLRKSQPSTSHQRHPDLLELWESELNQKLVPKKNYVCELHFNEEDIIKSDKIKTANGIIEELVRKRYALKQGAIPTLNPKKLSESRNTKDVNSPNSPSTEPVASEPNNIVYINENCSHQDSELQIDEDFNSNYVRLENFNSRISSEEINHENEEPVYELPISEVNIEKFSLQTIVNALKFNPLPENWSWTTDSLDSKKLVLCYIDKVSMKLKFRVKINQNFKVWLTNIKTDKLIDLNKCFSNISDFWNFLRELEKYTLCDGTEFDTEKCSSDCTGMPLSHEEYKKQMNGFRCVACRKVRHKLQNQSYKTKSDYKERYDNLKYQESLKNKQIERLQRKNKLLKEIIDTQKANCLAIKDDALRAEISILPPLQQLAIRACFNAAKVSNPKQRRYTVHF